MKFQHMTLCLAIMGVPTNSYSLSTSAAFSMRSNNMRSMRTEVRAMVPLFVAKPSETLTSLSMSSSDETMSGEEAHKTKKDSTPSPPSAQPSADPMALESEGSSSKSVTGYKVRDKIKTFAKSVVIKPISSVVTPAPKAIATILTDATAGAASFAVDEVYKETSHVKRILRSTRAARAFSKLLEEEAAMEGDTALALDSIALAKTAASDAFSAAEAAIEEAERALGRSKAALAVCKMDVAEAIAEAEKAAAEASRSAQRATVLATTAIASSSSSSGSDVSRHGPGVNGGVTTAHGVAGERDDAEDKMQIMIDELENSTSTSATISLVKEATVDVSSLTYDDVDYHMSEMAPPFIGEDQCLVPGEPVVRVEKAPENSRRIFAGIDIMASVDDVWNVLTDYERLQNVVPNLVVNDVLELYDAQEIDSFTYKINPNVKSEEQCRALSTRMKGAKLKQVGGAKVVGINFSARTTLEVREWPQGIPDFFHFSDDVFEGQSREERVRKEKSQQLERYHFPRPFAISKLPTKDISMQSVVDDDGEFRLYQGVWRMQPLPGCAPADGAAMRLTYAVEISPRPYLPVALVEKRISQDLCNNLMAIRDFVSISNQVQA